MQNNCYDILGVDCHASPKEIKTAFRRLAKKWHPDLNPGVPGQNERFSRIHQAYKILADPEERARHDAALWPQPQKPGPASKPAAATRTGPAPRPKEHPKEKPRTQPRPKAPPPPQDILAAKFAIYLKRLKELFPFEEQGAPKPRRAPPRPTKPSADGESRARQPAFDRVFQTVRTQGATGFVLCSDGIIRRIGRTASKPDEKKHTGPGPVPNHAWRTGLGVLVFLLVKWWHELNR